MLLWHFVLFCGKKVKGGVAGGSSVAWLVRRVARSSLVARRSEIIIIIIIIIVVARVALAC